MVESAQDHIVAKYSELVAKHRNGAKLSHVFCSAVNLDMSKALWEGIMKVLVDKITSGGNI